MMSTKLVIRLDATSEMGAGHAMRMLALAQAWRQRGGYAHVVAAAIPDGLVARFQSEQIETTQLVNNEGGQVAPGSDEDARQTAAIAKRMGVPWVIADGYSFNANFQSLIREAGFQLAVVTDFDYCEQWQSDLILNQNLHAAQEAFASSVPTIRRLLGTRFAMLRQEFLEAHAQSSQPERSDTKRLLITLGGSDPPNATGQLLELLQELDLPPLHIKVLVGVANPHRDSLDDLADCSHHEIELLTDVRDMPGQYLWADGIVSAGGGTCWEWLYFGLRGAVVVIADNQTPSYKELMATGAALGLGTVESLQHGDPKAKAVLTQLLDEMSLVTVEQRRRYRHLVDGYGAHRVAAQLDGGIWLRSAEADDCQRYFQWANDPAVRDNSLSSDEITWTGHCDWFNKQLASDETKLLVGIRDDVPVGQIRFTKTTNKATTNAATNDTAWNVAFSVASEARGTGVGKELLRLGSAWMAYRKLTPLTATVKKANTASARCFQSLGWSNAASADPELLTFSKI